MASEGKAATVKPVAEPVGAPAAPQTTAELNKAQEAQAEATAAPAVASGNGVHGGQSDPVVEKDIEGLRDPAQKVGFAVACAAPRG
jgi:hypothetical protein